MRAYFSHSIIADKHENFGFNLWIDTCINLLKYIKEDGVNISDEQIERMNVRNVDDIIPNRSLEFLCVVRQREILYFVPNGEERLPCF